ncbi:MAG: SAM-dependent methyltransferase [Firmicutes bacterium]|nr:SAM-dependent methyltransferase [Bacillota bacterium]
MADIGTDHGFLPIYLLKNGISPRVIMSDVNSGPLARAKQNYCESFGIAEVVGDINSNMVNHAVENADFRLGSGLETIGIGEVDDIVIAGMGGKLIVEILMTDFEKTASFKRFILQPRNGLGHLRSYLNAAGFDIEKELLVREADNICNVIVVSVDSVKLKDIKLSTEWFRNYEPTPEEEYPAVLADGTPLNREYLEKHLEKYREIARKINELSADGSDHEKLQYVNGFIEHLEGLK